MSKIKHAEGKERKFLTVAVEILQGMLEQEGILDNAVQNADINSIHKLFKKASNDSGITYKEDKQEPLGHITITTYNENNEKTPAQVKFFRIYDNEKHCDSERLHDDVNSYDYESFTGKINMERFITGLDGTLEADILCGRYLVEISKGSEYGIIKDYIEVGYGITNKEYYLKSFIDLSKYGWYAGDIHHHSIYSSPVYKGDDDVTESPMEVANSMMAMGLRYGALSDHHNILCHEKWRETKNKDFLPIVSKEISTSNGHVIALGAKNDVIFRIPDEKDRSDEYMRSEFIRITDEIKQLGGLAQLNHPCDLSKSISWNPEYIDIIDIFETIEIWNGSVPMIKGSTNYKAYELWLSLLKQGIYIPATTGSDTHNIKADDYNDYYELIQKLYKVISAPKYPKLKKEIHVEKLIFKKAKAILEKWAKMCLTSGCVRTYVHVEDEITEVNIMNGLRQGKSFLTNGPILIYNPCNGEAMNEDYKGNLLLMSARPLQYLRIYSPKGLYREIKLDSNKALLKRDNCEFYDYSFSLKDDKLLKLDWYYFVAADDCTNMAITNPYFN